MILSLDGSDRRKHTRWPVPQEAGLKVILHTFDTRHRRINVPGEPVNLSRGGLLVRVPELPEDGATCLAQFTGAGDAISPEYAPGRLVVRRAEDDTFAVAVQFHRPLDFLRPPSEN